MNNVVVNCVVQETMMLVNLQKIMVNAVMRVMNIVAVNLKDLISNNAVQKERKKVAVENRAVKEISKAAYTFIIYLNAAIKMEKKILIIIAVYLKIVWYNITRKVVTFQIFSAWKNAVKVVTINVVNLYVIKIQINAIKWQIFKWVVKMMIFTIIIAKIPTIVN